MAAVFGSGAVTGIIDSIFSRLVGAFQRVFQTALKFTKPRWVLLFAVGAPILFKLIDNAISIAKEIVKDWSDTIMQTAYNVYSAVLNYLCNSLGCTVSGDSCTCNMPIIGGLVAAIISQLAMLLSGPLVIVALFLKYVVVPLATWILTMLKNVVSAVYEVVCKVLVPIVRIVIGALTAYNTITRVKNNIYDALNALADGRLVPSIISISMPFIVGFISVMSYDTLLSTFGACTGKAIFAKPGTPLPPTIKQTNTSSTTIASSETIVAYLAPQGKPKAIFNYSITAVETLAAQIYEHMIYKYYLDIKEDISALIKAGTIVTLNINTAEQITVALVKSTIAILNVNAVEQIAALIKAFKQEFTIAVNETITVALIEAFKQEFTIAVNETITAVLQGLIAIITALENYWPYITINVTAQEKYWPYITINVTAQEKYMPAISAVITAQETYTSGLGVLITVQEEYLLA